MTAEAGMSDTIVVLVTAASAEQASAIARPLVEERLAACVNIVSGLRSIYRWQGSVCDDAEVLMLIKSTRERFRELRDRVLALHPYEVAEVLALPVVDGSEKYLAWLTAQATPA
jgi:periplasmic divalent cation tolerance protein